MIEKETGHSGRCYNCRGTIEPNELVWFAPSTGVIHHARGCPPELMALVRAERAARPTERGAPAFGDRLVRIPVREYVGLRIRSHMKDHGLTDYRVGMNSAFKADPNLKALYAGS